jgi:hypothetical protein
MMPDAGSKLIKLKQPHREAKRHSVTVSLNESEFRQVSIAAKGANQTVAAWIADMVYTSTQP